MRREKGKKGSIFTEIFDVLFIMILCFATLLTTMLMQGGVLVGSGSTSGIHYTFSTVTFLMMLLGLAIYLIYVIPHSDRELRAMIKQIYGDKQ